MNLEEIKRMGLALQQVREAEKIVCKECGDELGKPTNETCEYDSKNPRGENWTKKGQMEDASNDKSDDGEGMDKVDPKAAKKKFKDRKDTDLDNDGDTDSTDKYLHKKRKAIGKAMDGDDDKETLDDDKGQFIHAAKMAKKDGKKDFVFAGKKYPVDMKEAEMNEILGTIAKGVGNLAKKAVVNKQGNFRLSTAGRADAAQNKAAKMKKKAADINRKKDAGADLKKAKTDVAAAKARKEALSFRAFKEKFLTDDKKQTAKATNPEGILDKSKSSKGAMDMMKDAEYVKNNVDDTEAKGHNDAAQAGKKGPNGKARKGDNGAGDKSIINKPTEKK